MLKKMLLTAICIATAMSFTACSSVEMGTDLHDLKLTTDTKYESAAHMNVDIWGIYIFDFPIFTGSSREIGKCCVFQDTVTTNDATLLLTGAAKAKFRASALADMQTARRTKWIWQSLFFFYKEVQASANVLK